MLEKLQFISVMLQNTSSLPVKTHAPSSCVRDSFLVSPYFPDAGPQVGMGILPRPVA